MKTLIVYASKSGTTEKCAQILAEKLSADVKDAGKEKIDIEGYDTVIIGSSIRMGRIQKSVKDFIDKNIGLLLKKKIGLFICCGFTENANQFFSANFPQNLLDSAIAKECFGGELDKNKLHGLDKIIAGMVTKTDPNRPAPKILLENINKLAASCR
ncbi:MAG: flavodoxin domain-containing protein [Bacillota bacterium]|nr:flavodoxin domain-containing protein [Bacillota bacterium]